MLLDFVAVLSQHVPDATGKAFRPSLLILPTVLSNTKGDIDALNVLHENQFGLQDINDAEVVLEKLVSGVISGPLSGKGKTLAWRTACDKVDLTAQFFQLGSMIFEKSRNLVGFFK